MKVRYRGSPQFAGMLAQMLREEGLEVEYTSPDEGRTAATDATVEVVFYIVDKGVDVGVGVGGAVLAPKVTAAIKRFKERVRRAEVGIVDQGPERETSSDN